MSDLGGGDRPAELADYADNLGKGIDASLATWVVRCVTEVMTAWRGQLEPEVILAADEAGERCRVEIGRQIRTLLDADIDEQRGTPLALLRQAVRYPTAVLRAAGVPPVERDSFTEGVFPDDDYDLSPASLSDVAPSLADLGMAWGAAKAFEHKRRHRRP